MGLGPEEQHDLGNSEGFAFGRDPAESIQGDPGQAEGSGKSQKARRTCRTTPSKTSTTGTSGTGALSRLFATALHALASICAYQDSNTGGIIRPSEANVGTPQAQESATASWSWQLGPGRQWHGTASTASVSEERMRTRGTCGTGRTSTTTWRDRSPTSFSTRTITSRTWTPTERSYRCAARFSRRSSTS